MKRHERLEKKRLKMTHKVHRKFERRGGWQRYFSWVQREMAKAEFLNLDFDLPSFPMARKFTRVGTLTAKDLADAVR